MKHLQADCASPRKKREETRQVVNGTIGKISLKTANTAMP